MLPAGGRQHRGCIIPQAVTHSLVFLKMGKIIARNMLSWLELLINRYCCIQLVVYIIYFNNARSSKHQINAVVKRGFKLTLLNHCRNTALQIQAYIRMKERLDVKVTTWSYVCLIAPSKNTLKLIFWTTYSIRPNTLLYWHNCIEGVTSGGKPNLKLLKQRKFYQNLNQTSNQRRV
jgi:hypothetical protein